SGLVTLAAPTATLFPYTTLFRSGGGAGMVLKPEPVFNAMDALDLGNPRVILMCPQGRPFDQRMAESLSGEDDIVFICGHYEGYDERIRTLLTDEVSIGDYVLT